MSRLRNRRVRWLVRLVGVLVVLGVVGAVGIYVYLDVIAQQAIERGGAYATGVPTRVASVSVQPVAGEVALHELTIANPEGFAADHFFTLARGQMQVRLGSLMQERVVVPRLHLQGVRLSFQHDGRGRANYQIIMANLRKLAQPPRDQQGKRYLIRELVISDIELWADLPFVSSIEQPIRIADIRLTDVGSETEDGVLMSQLTRIVVQAVLRKAAVQLVDLAPPILAEALEFGFDVLDGDATQQRGGQRAVEQDSDEDDQASGFFDGLNTWLGGTLEASDTPPAPPEAPESPAPPEASESLESPEPQPTTRDK